MADAYLKKGIIAMVHLDALPGTPKSRMTVDQITAKAVSEVAIYKGAGVDAIMVENMHDVPYLNQCAGPEVVATMAVVSREVARAANGLPCGVQNKEAIAVAQAAGLQFIRAEGFVFGHVADEGYIDSCAGGLLRYRRAVGAENVRVFTDIKKKHSSHAVTADVDIVETAHAAEYFLSDGVIVTGAATGREADLDAVARVHGASGIPVLVGSGVTVGNVDKYLAVSDALIVGSHFKRDGFWANDVDPQRVGCFMDRVRSLRMQKTASIEKEDLRKYYHLPIQVVAGELGICTTMLKQLCRKHGIHRWPHRKIQSLNNAIMQLETMLAKPDLPPDVRQQRLEELATAHAKKRLILEDPNAEIDIGQTRDPAKISSLLSMAGLNLSDFDDTASPVVAASPSSGLSVTPSRAETPQQPAGALQAPSAVAAAAGQPPSPVSSPPLLKRPKHHSAPGACETDPLQSMRGTKRNAMRLPQPLCCDVPMQGASPLMLPAPPCVPAPRPSPMLCAPAAGGSQQQLQLQAHQHRADGTCCPECDSLRQDLTALKTSFAKVAEERDALLETVAQMQVQSRVAGLVAQRVSRYEEMAAEYNRLVAENTLLSMMLEGRRDDSTLPPMQAPVLPPPQGQFLPPVPISPVSQFGGPGAPSVAGAAPGMPVPLRVRAWSSLAAGLNAGGVRGDS
eukprot:m51a1_g9392 hypothetical protein (679) ;mRNA; f:256711-259848